MTDWLRLFAMVRMHQNITLIKIIIMEYKVHSNQANGGKTLGTY